MKKDQEVLGILLKAIESRDGKEKVEQLQRDMKSKVFDSLHRETICQILALEKMTRRFSLLVMYPEYILPYLFRVRSDQK